jgi:hypothetical protein
MSSNELPPPPPACLERPYPSSQKGGTLIAEDVWDLEQHQRRLVDPDGYRPRGCSHCGGLILHAHDFRYRHLRADPWIEVACRRYRCTFCGGRWQVLPAFVARWLWRSWRVVGDALGLGGRVGEVEVPRQTRRRWTARLQTSARSLVQVFASSAAPALEELAMSVGLRARRVDLVLARGEGLAPLAALIHRLVPGLRLM